MHERHYSPRTTLYLVTNGELPEAGQGIYLQHEHSPSRADVTIHQMPQSALLGSAMQSLTGGVILWISAGFTGEFRALHLTAVTTRSWIAIAYLICFGSAIGFSSYLYILKHSTATRVATYAFVNPIVALFLGWLLLNEAITTRTILASAVILVAVLLVITAPHREAPKTTTAAPSKVIEATEDPAF